MSFGTVEVPYAGNSGTGIGQSNFSGPYVHCGLNILRDSLCVVKFLGKIRTRKHFGVGVAKAQYKYGSATEPRIGTNTSGASISFPLTSASAFYIVGSVNFNQLFDVAITTNVVQ